MATKRLIATALFLFFFSAAAVHSQDGKSLRPGSASSPSDVIVNSGEVKWGDGPPSLPPGAKLSVLEGDPMKPGPFTMRLKLPAGYKIPPHTHPVPEHVTVISGEFNIKKGEQADFAKGNILSPGSFFLMAPGSAHYAWADKETVIQLHGTGPWDIQYANPQDDPRKKRG